MPVSEYINLVKMTIPSEYNWQYVLGHVFDKYAKLFIKHKNLTHSDFIKISTCKICIQAKIHQLLQSKKLPFSEVPFHLLHTDVL